MTFDKTVSTAHKDILNLLDVYRLPASVVILICENIIATAKTLLVMELPVEQPKTEIKEDVKNE